MNMKICFKPVLLIILFYAGYTPAQASEKESIVKIYATFNEHDFHDPWQMVGQNKRYGSGCIIENNRILTNAHVVGDYTFLEVRRSGSAKRYQAEVAFVAHECDLAVLEVKDPSFFKGAVPLRLGELPRVRDKVAVYGFPIGGDKLSITEGVVSRVEHNNYTHSSAHLLTCQIDAAINPGNSGGPVLMDNKIAGVAFQAGRGENIGYMVPAPIVKHFLEDITDGRYDGIPSVGVTWQDMENADLRRKYGLPDDKQGIMIREIYQGSAAEEILKEEDIILAIDGINIENDGTVEFRKNERTDFAYIIQNKFIGDTIDFTVLRDSAEQTVKIRLKDPVNFWHLVPRQQYDTAPTYFIIGGLVFEPLTTNFLQEWHGNWKSSAPNKFVYYYYYGSPDTGRKQLVILINVLADEANMGYHNMMYLVITEVNGRKISTMKDLVDAVEQNQDEYHTFIDEEGFKIVLSREKAGSRTPEILDRYKISSDRSEDLKTD
ncbi:MAG: trypsin-like peptidase domain-containing protein [Elusimicrobia bacterium]|nr:trypsin-like peptidase domain-containing protein [Elusimicrobiota bacterium]